MDFSFEKSNSAYMLFYEQCPVINCDSAESASSTLESNENLYLQASSTSIAQTSNMPTTPTLELSKELESWIWQDNMHFIQDKNIFEHTYFK